MNSSTHSIGTPSIRIVHGGSPASTFWSFVFGHANFKPSGAAKALNNWRTLSAWSWSDIRMAASSAKARSVKWLSPSVMHTCGARWPKIQSIATRNSILGLEHTLAEHQMLWKSDERTCYQFLLWHQYECEGLQSDASSGSQTIPESISFNWIKGWFNIDKWWCQWQCQCH